MKKAILYSFLMAIFAITFSACSGNTSKLEKICEETKSQLPQNLGGGLKVTDISLENGNVVYSVECMEVACGRDYINFVNENNDVIKASIIASLKQNPQLGKMFDILKEEDANIEYRFKGKPSGNTAVVVISNSEL